MRKRRLKKAKLSFVSLCPRGKNGMKTIYKDDDVVEFQALVKGLDEDHGELLAVVYAPDRPDHDGDFASAEVIKDMAYDYMRGGGKIDVRHNLDPLKPEQAFIAESFLIQKADPRFAGLTDHTDKPVDPTGGWGMVIKIEDDKLRAAYREKGWNGVSMFGEGIFEQLTDKELIEAAIKHSASRITKNPFEELNMDKKELVEALSESNAKLISELVKALEPKKEEPKKEEPKKEEPKKAPEISFDVTNLEEVKKHLASIKAAKVKAEIDWTNPEAVEKYLKLLEEKKDVEDEEEEDDDIVDKDDSEEVARLKRQLAKAMGKSNSNRVKNVTGGDGDFLTIAKEMAGYANGFYRPNGPKE